MYGWEHPFFSDETVDTARHVLSYELAPVLLAQKSERRVAVRLCPTCTCGHRMAKAALENAVWDLESQMQGMPLAWLLAEPAM
jgi:O-succinylbenzoate synthase